MEDLEGDSGMTQWLTEWSGLPEDIVPIPITHMAANSHL